MSSAKKLFIATPMYGGNCKAVYTHSLVHLVTALQERGYEVAYDYTMNESLITRARNTLVDDFLQTDFGGLLFIDSDHGFDVEDVIRMVESGKDIISAVAPMKEINWEAAKLAYEFGEDDLSAYAGYFAMNFDKSVDEISLNEPAEVENIGTGLMYISRKVFEELAPICKSYFRAERGSGAIQEDKEKIIEFFYTDINENGVLLSEDFQFCRMWKSLGNKIYAAPWVYITHSGEYNFKAQFRSTMAVYAKATEEKAS
jgi:hypothetical protein